MTDRLTIFGTGVDYDVHEIDEQSYNRLLQGGLDAIDYDELPDSDRSSGCVPDGYVSTICINEKPVITLGEPGEEPQVPPIAKYSDYRPEYGDANEYTLTETGRYYLIRCLISRGGWHFIDIKSEFDPNKLCLHLERIRLSKLDPDWESLIYHATYSGESMEFEETTSKGERWFLVDDTGNVKELE